MSFEIRSAITSDISKISTLVNFYAEKNLMLPRSEAQIRRAIDDFIVAVENGELIGCASLATLNDELAEIRALAVAPECHGRSVGSQLVKTLLDLAQVRNLQWVCALTLRPNFFQQLGFKIVDRWNLTPKIWNECVYCPKYHRCDEIPVLLNVSEPAWIADEPPWWKIVAQYMPLPLLRQFASRKA